MQHPRPSPARALLGSGRMLTRYVVKNSHMQAIKIMTTIMAAMHIAWILPLKIAPLILAGWCQQGTGQR